MSEPISLPFSGTTDATGSFKFATRPRPAYWSTLKPVARLQGTSPGNAQWTIKVAGVEVDFGNGPRISLGNFAVPPGAEVTVEIANALPSMAVSGQLVGRQHQDMSAAADALSVSSTPLTVATLVQPALLIKQVFTSLNVITVTPPSGTLSLRIGAVGQTTEWLLSVVGHQSGVGYFPNTQAGTRSSPGQLFLPITIPVELDWDTSFDITIDPATNASMTVLVSALPQVETAEVYDQASLLITRDLGATTRENDTAAGGRATLTFGAATGQRWILNALVAALFQTGANAGAANLRVWDGPAGTGALLLKAPLFIASTTANSGDRLVESGLEIACSLGNVMIVEFDAAASATIVEYVTASAWQRNF